ncbi:MAG: hypothetical protein AB7S75_20605 [Desulfococcaceae bacterium]
MRVIQTGSPPEWTDVPAEYQPDLAALERLDDNALWDVVRSRQPEGDFSQYQDLLDKNKNQTLSDREQCKLAELRTDFDRFMLRKAHAAALLRWRGHQIPPPYALQVKK